MADLCINVAISEMSPSACHGVATKPSFPVDVLEFLSSVDDAFADLMALATYISRHFLHFIEDLLYQDVLRCFEDLLCAEPRRRFTGSSISNPVFETASRTNTGISGIRAHALFVDSLVNTTPEIAETRQHLDVSLVFEGSRLPVSGVRFALKFAQASWRFIIDYIAEVRASCFFLVSRLQNTLRGSSDDIGWLQHFPDVVPAEDGTARYLELLQAIRKGEHKLPDSFVYLLIPGLFSNLTPLYFVTTKRSFSKMGLACHIAKIHSEASVENNALVLKQYVDELYWGSGKRVMLLGHSKGGVDAAAALSIYSDDLRDKVAGLAVVQSPYGGTPIASDILREGQIADKETRRVMEFLICKLIKGDIRALEDLTYEKRREFLAKHKLPDNVPLVSFHSEAPIAPGVIATMTRIAHAELPWLSLPLSGGTKPEGAAAKRERRIPVVIPISAAMAICALHLKLRYGEKSDGLVTCRDAEVPGSVVVRPDRKLDHAFMVYGTSKKKENDEADASEMCEALLTMLVEIGGKQKRQQSVSNTLDRFTSVS